MIERRAGWIGGGVALYCCLSQVLAAVLLYHSSVGWDYFSLLLLGFPIVGAVIVSQQPRNTIGWLLVGCSASIFSGLLLAGVVLYTLGSEGALWQELFAWFTNIIFIGGFEALLVSMVFLFPTGRTLSPRWRVAGQAVAAVLVANFVIVGLQPGPVGGYFAGQEQLTNPFGLERVGTLIDSLRVLFVPLGMAVVFTCFAAVAVRVKRARGIERLQLQWIALALALVGLGILTIAVAGVVLEDAQAVTTAADALFFSMATLGVSAAIGVAILRYHLYDIGRIVNRTIVYLSLTLTLAIVYVVLALLLGEAMGSLTGASGNGVTAAATLGAVALFSPLRSRIQYQVDRRFYRRKYDSARMVDAFAAQMRNEVDLAAVEAELQRVVTHTVQPAYVSIWLRTPATGDPR